MKKDTALPPIIIKRQKMKFKKRMPRNHLFQGFFTKIWIPLRERILKRFGLWLILGKIWMITNTIIPRQKIGKQRRARRNINSLI